jgi:hypothetical protein
VIVLLIRADADAKFLQVVNRVPNSPFPDLFRIAIPTKTTDIIYPTQIRRNVVFERRGDYLGVRNGDVLVGLELT